MLFMLRSYGVSHSVAINCETSFQKYAGVPITSTDAPSATTTTTYMSLIQLKANKNSPAHTFDKISVYVAQMVFDRSYNDAQTIVHFHPAQKSFNCHKTNRGKKPAHSQNKNRFMCLFPRKTCVVSSEQEKGFISNLNVLNGR